MNFQTGFKQYSLDQALERILRIVPTLASEMVPLADAVGRIAAKDVAAPINLPPDDNSSVDGYAVLAESLAAASATNPVTLQLAGYAPAGKSFLGKLEPGSCVRIFTGSVLPRGADAVVMQEDVKPDSDNTRNIQFLEPVKPWDNVRFLGEDVQKNVSVLDKGERLAASRVALLGAVGCVAVLCHRRPVVTLLATGDELREAGQRLDPGAIYESNRLSLSIFARQAGATVKTLAIVPDHLLATKLALEQAFAESDVVVSSGGVSVGELDLIRTAFAEIGGKLNFWTIAMKPGKPLAFGTRLEKLFFGLPGNPVSAMVTFFLLVRPALLQLQGAEDLLPPSHPATLAEPLVNSGDRCHFMRITLDSNFLAYSSGKQASHILSASARAQGLVEVPPNTTLASGSVVTVLRWD